MKKLALFIWKYWIFGFLFVILVVISFLLFPYVTLRNLGLTALSLQVELTIYLALAAPMFVYRTIISGRKLGSFYHKNDKPLPPFLKDEIQNIHFLETDAWRSMGIAASLLVFAIERSLNHTVIFSEVLIQIGTSLLFMMGTVLAASLHFQIGVTAGLKDAAHLDTITKSEVAIDFWFIKFSFWKPRIFSNKGRIVAQWLGIAMIIASIYLMIWL